MPSPAPAEVCAGCGEEITIDQAAFRGVFHGFAGPWYHVGCASGMASIHPRDVDAIRAFLLARLAEERDEDALRDLAAIWCEHPDYREEWAAP
jgi:hypothetical protein